MTRQSALTTALELAAARLATPRRKRLTLRMATAPIAEMLRSKRLAEKKVNE